MTIVFCFRERSGFFIFFGFFFFLKGEFLFLSLSRTSFRGGQHHSTEKSLLYHALSAPSKCPENTSAPSAEKAAEWHAEPQTSDCEQKPRLRSQSLTERSLPAERAQRGSAGEAAQQVTFAVWPVRVCRTRPEPSIEDEGEDETFPPPPTLTSQSRRARSSPPASSPRPSQVKVRQVTVSSIPRREPTQPTWLVVLLGEGEGEEEESLLLSPLSSRLLRIPLFPLPPAESDEGSQRRTTRSAPAVARAFPALFFLLEERRRRRKKSEFFLSEISLSSYSSSSSLSLSFSLFLSLSLLLRTRTVERRSVCASGVWGQACRERVRQQRRRGKRRGQGEEGVVRKGGRKASVVGAAAVATGSGSTDGGSSAFPRRRLAPSRRTRRSNPHSFPPESPVQKPARSPAHSRRRRRATSGRQRRRSPRRRPRRSEHVVALLVDRVHALYLVRFQLDEPPGELCYLELQGSSPRDGLLLGPKALPQLFLGGRRGRPRGVCVSRQLRGPRPELLHFLRGHLQGLGLGLPAVPRGRQSARVLESFLCYSGLVPVGRRGLPSRLQQLPLRLARPRSPGSVLP